MCDKDWEELLRAVAALERSDEKTRERLRMAKPVLWFEKEEKEEHPA